MATSPEQLCGIPSNLCVLFGSIHSPALPIPRCIFSSLLKPLIVLPHQRRAWFLFCWENWSNAKKISNNIHYIYLTKWLLTYLIYLSVHLPTYLLSIHLSLHPSILLSIICSFSSWYNRWIVLSLIPGILSTFHASSPLLSSTQWWLSSSWLHSSLPIASSEFPFLDQSLNK